MKKHGLTIAGNWKMNHAPVETRKFFESLTSLVEKENPAQRKQIREQIASKRLQLSVFPPAVSFEAGQEGTRNLDKVEALHLQIGSQNTHWEKAGAFTGEVSGPILKELGIAHSLVGHSERRQFYGETNETAKKRADSLLDQGFSVIFCVGETRAEREAGDTQDVIAKQLREGLPAPRGNLIVAYEPVWAIGTGLNATAEQAEEVHQYIRGVLPKDTPILYGGSVNDANVASLLACPNVDGVLVGGASLKPESYWKLVLAASKLLLV
ncbi:triose-phosphate isomerase [bacterium]|nr:triose-phosphate isomerase [bacterium]